MRKIVGVVAVSLLTAACGANMEQRSATGGLTGAGIGALAGGPIGALIGFGAGAAGGAMMPEDASIMANQALGREHQATSAAFGLTPPPQRPPQSVLVAAPPKERVGVVKQAQIQLKQMGLYKGEVDGIVGRRTRHALRVYQLHEGLESTGRLDHDTIERLKSQQNSDNNGNNDGANTNDSAPPASSGTGQTVPQNTQTTKPMPLPQANTPASPPPPNQ